MKRGSSLMEYMIVLGIISAVLWGMNIYVKRGVQGKLKDLTDSFIGKEQETDISPTAETTSSAKSGYSSTAETQASLGGGWRVSSSDKMEYEAESKITDSDVPYTSSDPVSAEEGYSVPEPAEPPKDGGTGG